MRTLVVAALLLLQGPGGLRVGGLITGEIRSADGPAVGVRVGALPAPDSAAATTGAGSTLASLAETDAAGRFRLQELPPGRYYIIAGALEFPSFYPGVRTQEEARIVTVTAGATVSGVDFTLARPVALRVSGRVKSFPAGAPEGLIRVSLMPGAGATAAAALNAPVKPDGTFEFSKVSPGRYRASLLPGSLQRTQVPVQIDDQDINLEMTMGQGVIGRVVVDGGGKLPLMPKLTPASPDVPMAVQLAWRPTTLSPAAAALAARGSALAGMLFTELAGGYFIVPATAGEYQLMADTLPFGFYLKSASYSPETNLLQVTLTTTPPSAPPGVKISGRITGLSGSGDVRGLVNMQMSTPNAFGLTEKRVGMALVGRDGTFEVSHVPPGVVVINVDSLGGATPSSFSTRLTVGDRDMFIEYRVSVSEPAESVPRVSPGAVPPAAPITVVVPDVSAPPQPAR